MNLPHSSAFAAKPEAGAERAFDDLTARSLQLLKEILRDVDSVALVDYPVSGNVGDSMIWLGQVALLKRLNKKIVYVDAAWHSDDAALRRVVEKGAAIVIMGGGNFGTLWPHHQRFREHLLQTFADATIVQMPQSIFFADDEAVERARRIVAGCNKFHLLVRDFPSLEFARANFDAQIELCPDSAFFLGALPAPHPDVDMIYLRRTDRESSAQSFRAETTSSQHSIEVTDWLRQNVVERALHKIVRALLRFRLLRNTSFLTAYLYNQLAWARVRRGISTLARGRCVVTDRLHAHVLCMLIGRYHLLLDNGIGKIFAFHEAWTQRWPSLARAETIEEAFALASAELRRAAARTAADRT